MAEPLTLGLLCRSNCWRDVEADLKAAAGIFGQFPVEPSQRALLRPGVAMVPPGSLSVNVCPSVSPSGKKDQL